MKIDLSDCKFEYQKRVSQALAEENGRSFKLHNESNYIITKWAIDREVFKNKNEQRCDFLFLVEREERNIYYWIELKGSDTIEAYKQILSTINNIDIEKSAIQQARIIATKVHAPDLRSKAYYKLEEVIKKSNGEIIVRTNHHSEKI